MERPCYQQYSTRTRQLQRKHETIQIGTEKTPIPKKQKTNAKNTKKNNTKKIYKKTIFQNSFINKHNYKELRIFFFGFWVVLVLVLLFFLVLVFCFWCWFLCRNAPGRHSTRSASWGPYLPVRTGPKRWARTGLKPKNTWWFRVILYLEHAPLSWR